MPEAQLLNENTLDKDYCIKGAQHEAALIKAIVYKTRFLTNDSNQDGVCISTDLLFLIIQIITDIYYTL